MFTRYARTLADELDVLYDMSWAFACVISKGLKEVVWKIDLILN